jgi:hypothetical protein
MEHNWALNHHQIEKKPDKDAASEGGRQILHKSNTSDYHQSHDQIPRSRATKLENERSAQGRRVRPNCAVGNRSRLWLQYSIGQAVRSTVAGTNAHRRTPVSILLVPASWEAKG